MMLRATVVIDYQNVHLTARDVFNPGTAAHLSLIHPVLFARTSITRRNQLQRPGFPSVELVRTVVYRGLPHVDYETTQNRRCLEQAEVWRNDGALVELRDLKYPIKYGADGRPVQDIYGKKVWTGAKPEEKGIDVLCALACVREAGRTDVDLVVLASRDTDLRPVLDEVHDMHVSDPRKGKIETVSWYDSQARIENRYAGGSLRPTGPRRIWNTNLGREQFEASRDRGDYT